MIKLTGVFPFLKCMSGISSFRFFRFSMSLHVPSDFCLINIGEIYSLVSYSHFAMTPFAISFWIFKFIADSPSFEN